MKLTLGSGKEPPPTDRQRTFTNKIHKMLAWIGFSAVDGTNPLILHNERARAAANLASLASNWGEALKVRGIVTVTKIVNEALASSFSPCRVMDNAYQISIGLFEKRRSSAISLMIFPPPCLFQQTNLNKNRFYTQESHSQRCGQ